MPGRSHRLRNETARHGITDEVLFDGIPVEGTALANGDIAEMAHSYRAVANLHIANRPLAGSDAVEEVIVVMVALVQFRRKRIWRKLFEYVQVLASFNLLAIVSICLAAQVRFNSASTHKHFAVAANEVYAVLAA